MFGSNGKSNNVGIIGMGIIGSRVAERLRKAKHQVFVWNRTIKPEPNFLASPREIAEVANFIQIFVRDDEALHSVMTELQPVLDVQHTLLVHSTVSPAAMKAAAEIASKKGAGFLDAPFTGSKMAAENGELVYYVGGEDIVLEKSRKVLEVSSKKILHFGTTPGDATVLKIATNLISSSVVEALAEALAITKAHGVSPEQLLEALIPNANCSPVITMKLPAMISGNFDPHFSLANMLKDARYAQDLARAKKLRTPVLDATTLAMSQASKNGHDQLDFSVVAKNFES
jgi:3-hydroxyisobutyrate dehydrogenase-like beta-hydroxyacid dehydrogenase